MTDTATAPDRAEAAAEARDTRIRDPWVLDRFRRARRELLSIRDDLVAGGVRTNVANRIRTQILDAVEGLARDVDAVVTAATRSDGTLDYDNVQELARVLRTAVAGAADTGGRHFQIVAASGVRAEGIAWPDQVVYRRRSGAAAEAASIDEVLAQFGDGHLVYL